MPRLIPLTSFSLFLLLGGCIQPGVANDPRDAAVIQKFTASMQEKPDKFGLRWPNGNGSVEERKVIDVTKLESRTNAFGKRELRCRVTTEVSRWKTIDGKRSGQPEVRRETEERWLTA